MADRQKDTEQLLAELDRLRQQVAELQDNAARRQHLDERRAAVSRLRDAVLRMKRASDIQRVAAELRPILEGLRFPFHAFGINVVEPAADGIRFYAYTWKDEGIDKPIPEAQAAILERFWRAGQPAYRPDLQTDDPYDELDYLSYWHIRSVLDIPFSHGTIAVSSRAPHAFSAQDIETLGELSQVLAAGFQRMEDFQELERRNQELERQIVERRHLEQKRDIIQGVRDAIWQMQNAEDFRPLAVAIKSGLESLGIACDAFGINILDAVSSPVRFYAYGLEDDGKPVIHRDLMENQNRILARIWQNGATAYRPDLCQEDPYQEAAYFSQRIRAVLDVPFSQGTLAISSCRPGAFSEGDIAILEALAQVLAEGFQRRGDLLRLARSEKRFRALVETPTDIGVAVLDLEGHYLYVSPQIERMTGYPAAVFYADNQIGRRITHPDDFAANEREFVQAARGETAQHREFRWQPPDGAYRWASQIFLPLYDDRGVVEAVQVVFRDITARKQAGETQRELERLRVLSEAAGGAAHAINQPLQGIVGLTEVLLLGVEPGDSRAARLRGILEQADRIGAILASMKNIHCYATTSYPGDSAIVDFDAVSDPEADRQEGEGA